MNMKKWCLFLTLYACACLLAACAASGGTVGETDVLPQEEPAGDTVVCRVISVLEGGTLILAEEDGDTGLYTVTPGDETLTLDGTDFDPAAPGAYQALPGGTLAGTTVTVTFDGGIQESWPMGFSGVTALDFSTGNFDDLGALYLQVLEDLWNVDSGLNENITELGVDLSQTRLSGSEQAAVAYAFGAAHGLMAVETTYDQLAADGYVTPVPLGAPAGEGEEKPELYQWETGCLFSITESEEPVVFSLPNMGPGDQMPDYDGVSFDARKWRSPLGAYYFTDCTAVSSGGHWGRYTVGSEMIS